MLSRIVRLIEPVLIVGGKELSQHRSMCNTLLQQSASLTESKPEGAMVASTNQVLMQMATVTVKNRKQTCWHQCDLYLIQVIHYRETIVKVLQLTLDRTEKPSVVIFGSSRPKSIDCKQGSLSLLLKDGNTITVVPSISGKKAVSLSKRKTYSF